MLVRVLLVQLLVVLFDASVWAVAMCAQASGALSVAVYIALKSCIAYSWAPVVGDSSHQPVSAPVPAHPLYSASCDSCSCGWASCRAAPRPPCQVSRKQAQRSRHSRAATALMAPARQLTVRPSPQRQQSPAARRRRLTCGSWPSRCGPSASFGRASPGEMARRGSRCWCRRHGRGSRCAPKCRGPTLRGCRSIHTGEWQALQTA